MYCQGTGTAVYVHYFIHALFSNKLLVSLMIICYVWQFLKVLGGLLCACCPHSVMYGIKLLLWRESHRDHVDMLLSFTYQPTLAICDTPSFVAYHGNKRKRNMFYPNEGRFCYEAVNTISRQKEGTLKVSLPELDMSRLLFTSSNRDHIYAQPDHPLTHIQPLKCVWPVPWR